MSKPTTFYRIYGSYKSVCLIPIPADKGASSSEVKQDADGSFYYEYKDTDDEVVERQVVYPSKAAAWESVKADLRAEIAEREKLLEAVILAWSKDEEVAKAPL